MTTHTRVGGNHPPEILSIEEFARILREVNTGTPWGWRNRAILETLYYSGLRRSEVTSLRAERVDLAGSHPILEVRDSKNGKGRNIPIDPRSMLAMRRWAIRRPDSPWFFCTVIRSPANGVSTNQAVGSQLSAEQLARLLKRCAADAGIERRVWLHMLRHSAATNWLRSGLNLEQVRVLLGHSRLETTQRYLHVAMSDIEQLIYGDEAANPEYKSCPYCAERVRVAAVRCRWCHESIPAAA